MVPQLALKHKIFTTVNVITGQIAKLENKVSHLNIDRIKNLCILNVSVPKKIDEPDRHQDGQKVYEKDEVYKL